MGGRRIRISFANVAATLALFLAAGGAWALAFSGSGKLQKAAATGFGDPFENIRTITGVGELQVYCDGSGYANVVVRLKNESGETLRVFTKEWNGTVGHFDESELADGEEGAGIGGFGQKGLVRYYVFPADGSKRPQADVTVSVPGQTPGDCDTAQVSVLDVTTEE
jgi:hypothetical protein